MRKFGLMDSIGLITKPANVINYDNYPNMINGIRNGNDGKLIDGSGGAATTIVG